jgi:hypothetical protein
MRRRDVIALGAKMAGTIAATPLLAQVASQSARAAVVIGIDRVGNLPALEAAAAGARMFAGWLRGEGFEVVLFTDESAAVRVATIYDAIERFVNRSTVDQLVIYFSGHGFLRNSTEIWMLSNGTTNPNEAISVVESSELARFSGIKNVVFISDACRSTPTSLGISLVRGDLIFPVARRSANIDTDIDLFFATHLGEPALELSVGDSVTAFEGIYTSCFLGAFEHPDSTMVKVINQMRVVPNNQLKDYLIREVRKKAEAKSIRLRQIPDTRVLSGDSTYIGRATGGPTSGIQQSESTIFDKARRELAAAMAGSLPFIVHDPKSGDVTKFSYASDSSFTHAQLTMLNSERELVSHQLRTGVHIVGKAVVRIVTNSKFQASALTSELFSWDAGVASRANINLGRAHGCSVAIQFDDGSGTLIAAISGYISNVTVKDGDVVNVSYIPSGAPRSPELELKLDYLSRLRTVVAESAKSGTFRIEGDRESRTRSADDFLNKIRISNGIDPTLGLYATYALLEAGLIMNARVVHDIILRDLSADLFDLALVSDSLSGTRSGEVPGLVPFCPMLARGWELLRVKDVRLPVEIERAKEHLRSAFWTTFDPDGMELVMSALRNGRAE